ncbi:MAG: hypothetical protein EOO40_08910, partial [Deltaproteobacteria bacterium]
TLSFQRTKRPEPLSEDKARLLGGETLRGALQPLQDCVGNFETVVRCGETGKVLDRAASRLQPHLDGQWLLWERQGQQDEAHTLFGWDDARGQFVQVHMHTAGHLELSYAQPLAARTWRFVRDDGAAACELRLAGDTGFELTELQRDGDGWAPSLVLFSRRIGAAPTRRDPGELKASLLQLADRSGGGVGTRAPLRAAIHDCMAALVPHSTYRSVKKHLEALDGAWEVRYSGSKVITLGKKPLQSVLFGAITGLPPLSIEVLHAWQLVDVKAGTLTNVARADFGDGVRGYIAVRARCEPEGERYLRLYFEDVRLLPDERCDRRAWRERLQLGEGDPTRLAGSMRNPAQPRLGFEVHYLDDDMRFTEARSGGTVLLTRTAEA